VRSGLPSKSSRLFGELTPLSSFQKKEGENKNRGSEERR